MDFEVKVGMHQASVLSPFLFAVVVDIMTEFARECTELPYADDLVHNTYSIMLFFYSQTHYYISLLFNQLTVLAKYKNSIFIKSPENLLSYVKHNLVQNRLSVSLHANKNM